MISKISLNEIYLSSNQLIGDTSIVNENLLHIPLISVVNILYNSDHTGRVSHVVCDFDQGHIFKVDYDVKCKCCDRSLFCICVDSPDFEVNDDRCAVSGNAIKNDYGDSALDACSCCNGGQVELDILLSLEVITVSVEESGLDQGNWRI